MASPIANLLDHDRPGASFLAQPRGGPGAAPSAPPPASPSSSPSYPRPPAASRAAPYPAPGGHSTTQSLYQCADCLRRYSRPEHLQRHIATHTLGKRFVCDVDLL
ncbi:hypothetical protein VTK73DRAFT_2104 [Phialemonium thermophilum]|uniref:C2H2-type domain-containing protein n=1 Tax=Phialemonium thermophilum TaxID=223376 RepID=A0ABR3VSL0_9PEZI